MKQNLNHSKGFSLIEALVAIGIMSVMMLIFMSIMQSQQKETRAVDEKMTILDMENQLRSALTSRETCGCLFRGKTLNTSGPTPTLNSNITSIPNGYSSPIPAAPTLCTPLGGNLVPPIGSVLPNSQIKISSISVNSITPQGVGYYTAQLEVAFDPNSMVRSRKPATATLSFTVDISTGDIKYCGYVAPAAGKGFCTNRVDWDNSNTLTCPPVPGFTTQRLTGVWIGAGARGSGCCYLPNASGSAGWCSPAFEGWNGTFSGCGTGNAYYDAVHINGVKNSTNDTHYCCFIPKNPHSSVPASDAFGTANNMNCNDSFSGCGGPFTYYDVITQNVVTSGIGRHCSCSYYSK